MSCFCFKQDMQVFKYYKDLIEFHNGGGNLIKILNSR